MDVKITDNSKEILNATDTAIEKALEMIGIKAERYAKLDCPVDTGLLRNSITYALSGKSPAIDSYTAGRKRAGEKEKRKGEYNGTMGKSNETALYIGTNVEYAKKVELGDTIEHTSGKAHFLRNALANHSDEYQKIAEKVLKGDHV